MMGRNYSSKVNTKVEATLTLRVNAVRLYIIYFFLGGCKKHDHAFLTRHVLTATKRFTSS